MFSYDTGNNNACYQNKTSLFIHVDLNWSQARSCLLLTDIYADASTSPS